MVQVEDLPEAMQRQAVGVPREWVRLFQHLTNAMVCYHNKHSTPQVYMSWDLYIDCICVLRVLAPIL